MNEVTSIIQTLLQHGADPNLSNKNHVTPLHIAAAIPSSVVSQSTAQSTNESVLIPVGPQITTLLIKSGAKTDVETISGKTPLHVAAAWLVDDG